MLTKSNIHIWSSSFAIICGLCVYTWYRFIHRTVENNETNEKKKNFQAIESQSEILSQDELLPKLGWNKSGYVAKLYIYPLLFGKGTRIQKCNFTAKGMLVQQKGKIDLQFSMFAVYDPKSNYIIKNENYPALLEIEVIVINKKKVKFTALSMPDLILDINQITKNNEIVQCYMCNFTYIKIKYIDCGTVAAKWMSKCLTGENCGLKLGILTDNSKHVKIYASKTLQGRNMCSFLSHFTLMSLQTIQELCKINNVSLFYPEIIISSNGAFVENNWKWIKIGNVIMKSRKFYERDLSELTSNEFEDSDKKCMTLWALFEPGIIKVGDDVYVFT